MSTSDQYKHQIMNDLAQGNTESLDEAPANPAKDYQNFDDFAQRSTHEERRHLFGKSLNHDSVPPSQLEPELQKAIAQIKPEERGNVARSFFKHLKERGLDERHLEQQLGLKSHNPSHLSADDVSKLASFTYHNHPDIFHEVLAEQPGVLKFLSNPLVGAALGAIASKWFGGHK